MEAQPKASSLEPQQPDATLSTQKPAVAQHSKYSDASGLSQPQSRMPVNLQERHGLRYVHVRCKFQPMSHVGSKIICAGFRGREGGRERKRSFRC